MGLRQGRDYLPLAIPAYASITTWIDLHHTQHPLAQSHAPFRPATSLRTGLPETLYLVDRFPTIGRQLSCIGAGDRPTPGTHPASAPEPPRPA